MCRDLSYFHRPDTGDVCVAVLNSHADTEKQLKLNLKLWREGHYLPDGTIEARVAPEDRTTAHECAERIRARWPRFVDFFAWALKTTNQEEKYGNHLDLSGLTSAQGLVLPKTVGGYIDLGGLTSADGLVLPKSIGGSIYLGGLTSAQGLVLPKTVGGNLYLRGRCGKLEEFTKEGEAQ